MRYSVFEQAAAEASLGTREIDASIEQFKAEIERLTSKRDLLDTVSRQLLSLRPTSGDAAPANVPKEVTAEAPALSSASAVEAEMAAMSAFSPARSLREEWLSRTGGDSGVRGPSSDSEIRKFL